LLVIRKKNLWPLLVICTEILMTFYSWSFATNVCCEIGWLRAFHLNFREIKKITIHENHGISQRILGLLKSRDIRGSAGKNL